MDAPVSVLSVLKMVKPACEGATASSRCVSMRAGRGERIRTSDTCLPKAVLYQAELHPVYVCCEARILQFQVRLA